ncbi:putative aminohydrolase SsnA [Sediminispirochaeta bajacaliforniensis]|uniref:putative aminohydrolase SsnA n=1 Tax=Sediminispirochaeta bajacaliforniensis TaxID=148 RepID=UPI0003827766|nr:putative aminohydrolase SsnA [Sediminispirochaeta bajacaliforniensis]
MIIIKDAQAMQFNPPRVWEKADIVIDGDTILAVGENAGVAYRDRAEKVIDASGRLVYPGLVCSHHHYYSGLSRGVMAKVGPTPDFVSTLRNLWWLLDRALDEESVYYSGLICSMDAIKSGTTAVIDHHASPSYIKGSLATLKKSFEKVGLRGMTCYETTDRNGLEGMEQGIEENIEFAKLIDEEKKSGRGDHLVEAAIGGHAPFTLPDAGLVAMKEAVDVTGRGIHLHVAEGRYDVSDSHLRFNKDLGRRLADHGLLNEKALLVHGIYLSDEDIRLINEADAYLVHNARSNMNNGVGYNVNLPKYKNLALGTDGIGANMFEEFKFAYFKHKDAGGPLWPDDYLRFLYNGNAILERYFDEKYGRLEAGYKADIVIADYLSPTPLAPENIAGHMAFGMTSGDVKTVLVNGRVVLEDGRFPFDAEALYAEARKATMRVWKNIDRLAD